MGKRLSVSAKAMYGNVRHISVFNTSVLLRCKWEDNIKMDLQEVEGGCGDWMELA